MKSEKTIKELQSEYNISYCTLYRRIKEIFGKYRVYHYKDARKFLQDKDINKILEDYDI